jgi:hypothetical protein
MGSAHPEYMRILPPRALNALGRGCWHSPLPALRPGRQRRDHSQTCASPMRHH